MKNIENILVIGAHGKIGKILCEKLFDTDPYKPTAFIRNEEQKPVFEKMNVPTIIGNLEDSVDGLTAKFKGFDCVIFTAGSGADTGADKTLAVDLDGAVRTMEAAEGARILRYIMVSAKGTDQREQWAKTEGMKPYYIAKHYADRMLRHSGLNYTILRPVMLTDDPGTGKINASINPGEISGKIPREDVAEVIVNSINLVAAMDETIEISSGDTPIPDALERILEREKAE